MKTHYPTHGAVDTLPSQVLHAVHGRRAAPVALRLSVVGGTNAGHRPDHRSRPRAEVDRRPRASARLVHRTTDGLESPGSPAAHGRRRIPGVDGGGTRPHGAKAWVADGTHAVRADAISPAAWPLRLHAQSNLCVLFLHLGRFGDF